MRKIHRVKFYLWHLHRFKSLVMKNVLIGIAKTVGENVCILLVRMPVVTSLLAFTATVVKTYLHKAYECLNLQPKVHICIRERLMYAVYKKLDGHEQVLE